MAMSIESTLTRTVALESALGHLIDGRPVVAVDDLHGTGVDMLALARTASTKVLSTMISEGTGFVCVTVDEFDAHRLCLPPMTWESSGPFGGRMCVAIDATEGVTTGISAHDRAVTLRAIGDPSSTPDSFTRPGHVVPVLTTTEGPIDRARLLAQAGYLCAEHTGDRRGSPVVFSALVSRRDPRSTPDIDEAGQWGLPIVRYSDLKTTVVTGLRGDA